MKEEIIIQGKPVKSKIYIICYVISAFLIVTAIAYSFEVYKYDSAWSLNHHVDYADTYNTWAEFFVSEFFRSARPYWLNFTIGIACLILSYLFDRYTNHCELTVTKTHIYGKSSFGKPVDLPFGKISSVSLGSLNSVVISNGTENIRFWSIDNAKSIHETISSLTVEKEQEMNRTTTLVQTSEADEIKKYKELLDSGVISKEEFDLKKKQLLGL